MIKIILPLVLAIAPAQALAGICSVFTPSIPTLDEIGLIGLAAVIGLAAGWAIKRRK